MSTHGLRITVSCLDANIVLHPGLSLLCFKVSQSIDALSDSEGEARVIKEVTVNTGLSSEQLAGLSEISNGAELRNWCDGRFKEPAETVDLFLLFDQLGLDVSYAEFRVASLLVGRTPEQLRDEWQMIDDISKPRSRDLRFQMGELPRQAIKE
jgi:hypothetical protein